MRPVLPAPGTIPGLEEEARAWLEASLRSIEGARARGAYVNLKVFVSSTFRDMHGERNVIARTVFPQLNEWGRTRRLNFVPVDLRWGLTKEDTGSGGKGALALCLEQAAPHSLYPAAPPPCLKVRYPCTQLDECRPYVIVLLGGRYGWRPAEYQIPDDGRLEWLSRYPIGHSITSMEIAYAFLAFTEPRMRAVVFDRDEKFVEERVPEGPARAVFREDDPEAAAMLQEMKERIRAHPYARTTKYSPKSFETYPDGSVGAGGLDEFADGLVKQLIAAAEKDFPPTLEESDPVAVDLSFHEQFVQVHCRSFLGRADVIERLLEHALGLGGAGLPAFAAKAGGGVGGGAGGRGAAARPKAAGRGGARAGGAAGAGSTAANDSGVLLLGGPPGYGKSSCLCKLVDVLRARSVSLQAGGGPAPLLVFYFVGRSPKSTSVPRMLQMLSAQIRRRLPRPEDGDDADGDDVTPEQPPEEWNALVRYFAESLKKAAECFPRVVVVIDALNQLAGPARTRLMDWLPEDVPPSVRFVLSSLPGEAAERLRQRRPPPAEVTLGEMPLDVRMQVVRERLAAYAKKLTDTEVAALASKPHAGSPLYLVTAIEELRCFGLFEQLGNFVRELPDTTHQLFGSVLSRLEVDHGRGMVQRALSLLAVSRGGLTEAELLARAAPSAAGLRKLWKLPPPPPGPLARSSGWTSGLGLEPHLPPPALRQLELLARPDDPQGLLPRAVWSRLSASLSSLLIPAGNDAAATLDYFHRQFLRAVRVRYLLPCPKGAGCGAFERGDPCEHLTPEAAPEGWDEKGEPLYPCPDPPRLAPPWRDINRTSQRGDGAVHGELAAYFRRRADPAGDASWAAPRTAGADRAFAELADHLRAARQHDELLFVLSSLRFQHGRAARGGAVDLLTSIHDAMESLPPDAAAALAPYERLIRRDARSLDDAPHLIFQKALNSKSDSAPALQARALLEAAPGLFERCLLWVNKDEVCRAKKGARPRPPRELEASFGRPASTCRLCEFAPAGDEGTAPRLAAVDGHDVRLFDGRAGAELASRRLPAELASVSFAPDGRTLAALPLAPGPVALLEGRTLRPLRVIEGLPLRALVWAPSSVYLVAIAAFHPAIASEAAGKRLRVEYLRLIQSSTGAEFGALPFEHPAPPDAAAAAGRLCPVSYCVFSPDGRRLLVRLETDHENMHTLEARRGGPGRGGAGAGARPSGLSSFSRP
eukprot:tig00000385_g24745.t1